MAVSTQLGLNKTQTKCLQEILSKPYEVFGLDGDPEESAQRALDILLKNDGLESIKISDVRRAISALRSSLSQRGKGLSREMQISTQLSRYVWAKEICARHTVARYPDLAKLCVKVWGARLPDRYKREIRSYLNTSSTTTEQGESGDFLKAEAEEVLSEKETNEESRVELSLGGVDFVLSKGCTLSVKAITSSNGSVLSDITVQS
tara:strand:- start:2459 stop:3073 length:615 start_codon:yes stop_codon:yes gene_type:complete